MIVITVANEKGGAGKTSTAAALWYWLNKNGRKALAVDFDAQGNLSFNAGADTHGPTALGVLMREAEPATAIQHTAGGDIIAASAGMNKADMVLSETGKEYRLKEALEPLAEQYDFVIVDTAPHLGVLTINALTAANYVIIPTQADIFSLQGIMQLNSSIESARKYCQNPGLRVAGILITRYSDRAILSRGMKEQLEQLAGRIGSKVYTASIREAIAVKEAQVQQMSIFDAAPGSKVANDYEEFIAEFMEDLENGKKEN